MLWNRNYFFCMNHERSRRGTALEPYQNLRWIFVLFTVSFCVILTIYLLSPSNPAWVKIWLSSLIPPQCTTSATCLNSSLKAIQYKFCDARKVGVSEKFFVIFGCTPSLQTTDSPNIWSQNIWVWFTTNGWCKVIGIHVLVHHVCMDRSLILPYKPTNATIVLVFRPAFALMQRPSFDWGGYYPA